MRLSVAGGRGCRSITMTIRTGGEVRERGKMGLLGRTIAFRRQAKRRTTASSLSLVAHFTSSYLLLFRQDACGKGDIRRKSSRFQQTRRRPWRYQVIAQVGAGRHSQMSSGRRDGATRESPLEAQTKRKLKKRPTHTNMNIGLIWA